MRADTTFAIVACLLATSVLADEPPTREALERVTAPQFSPYAGRNFPTRVLWGDTHLHTAVSVDAGTMNRVGQEDALRGARK